MEGHTEGEQPQERPQRGQEHRPGVDRPDVVQPGGERRPRPLRRGRELRDPRGRGVPGRRGAPHGEGAVAAHRARGQGVPGPRPPRQGLARDVLR